MLHRTKETWGVHSLRAFLMSSTFFITHFTRCWYVDFSSLNPIFFYHLEFCSWISNWAESVKLFHLLNTYPTMQKTSQKLDLDCVSLCLTMHLVSFLQRQSVSGEVRSASSRLQTPSWGWWRPGGTATVTEEGTSGPRRWSSPRRLWRPSTSWRPGPGSWSCVETWSTPCQVGLQHLGWEIVAKNSLFLA